MKKRVSVVIPLYNEESVVPELIDRLVALQQKLMPVVLDVVVVNDGSGDATRALLDQRLPDLKNWKLISLARNFGLQPAYKAGLDFAKGDAVVFMDGDLQDPPELIADMVSVWQEGYAVVVARRRTRRERGLRRVCFELFHWGINKLTGGMMPKDSGTFGLMDRRVADQVKSLREKNPFFPALRCWPGYSTGYVEYDRELRFSGETKQSYRRLINYAWDGVTSFSDAPLRCITSVGFLISSLAFLYACVLLVQRIFQFFGFFADLRVLGFTTIVLAILFMGGVQLMAIGIIGTYLSRIFVEVKDRPMYVVDEVLTSTGAVCENLESKDM